jgi:DNA-binding MarR family transcriptional regulator
LLASVPQNIFAAMEPHLKPLTLAFGDVVAETDKPVRDVIFPFSGVVSLVVDMQEGDMIETAMVGRDGVANGTSALDGKVSLHKGMVQVAGETATISPDALRTLAREFEPLQAILIRNEQVVLAQAQQSAGCNASHSVEARMCRWLLRIRDLTGSDDVMLTQQFLAQMLGVRRSSVTLVASTLQKAGFIRYSRGNIRLLDVEQLQQGACECYETVKGHYERLLVP